MSWISPSLSTSNEYIKYRIEITENATDQTLNTSNVTVSVWFWRTNTGFETYGTGTVYCTIDGTTYSASVKSSQKITSSGIYLFSKTLNIVHTSDGSKALIVSAYIDHSRFTSNSQSFTASLTTIPRCSRLSASSVELGTSMTITISKDDSTFQNLIHWECGSKAGILVESYTGSAYSWTPPVELAQEYPNVENVPIYLYCVTSTADGTVLGNSYIVVQCSIPASIVPTIAVDVDDNSGNFEKYQCFLQGFSTMKVKITAAGQYGASIVSYTSIIGGKTYTGANFTTEIINDSGTVTAQITVRDSRGRTSRLDYEFEVVQYDPPVVTSLTAIRCDADGSEYYQGQYCKLTFSAEITSLNGKNSASYRVECKKQDESTFSSMTVSAYDGQTSISNGTAMFAAENGSSYNIYLYAVDDFGESSKYVFSPSVFRLIHFGVDGQSIAFFKRCEGDVPGDFGQAIRFSGGYVPASANSVTSMDDLLTPGCYVSNGYSIENAPFYGDYFVEVRQLDDDESKLMQKADQYDDNGLTTLARFMQIKNGVSTWTAWKELYAMAEHRHAAEDIVQNNDEATALINAMKSALIDTIYPVGSIYISVSSTSPATLFGGSWTQIKDRFLLAAGSSYFAGEEGGAASYALSVAHTHVSPIGYAGSLFGFVSVNGTSSTGSGKLYRSITAANTGSSLGSNINMGKTSSATVSATIPTLPPYLGVYVWERTA